MHVEELPFFFSGELPQSHMTRVANENQVLWNVVLPVPITMMNLERRLPTGADSKPTIWPELIWVKCRNQAAAPACSIITSPDFFSNVIGYVSKAYCVQAEFNSSFSSSGVRSSTYTVTVSSLLWPNSDLILNLSPPVLRAHRVAK